MKRGTRIGVIGLGFWMAGAIAIAVGCSSSPEAPLSSTTSPGAASKVVGATGGSISTADGTKVEIPAGALASDTTITVTSVPSAALSSDIASVGTPVVLGPEGLKFEKPVTVTLAFQPEKLKAGRSTSDVVVLTAPKDSTSFTALTAPTVSGNTVSATTTHFSVFVPGTVECAAQCSGQDSSAGGKSCQCSATCLGVSYSMTCPDGACTCQDGAKGTTSCSSSDTSALFKSLCGFPGPTGSETSDAATMQPPADCTVQCYGSASDNGSFGCGCTTTCNGVEYKMDCPNGACTCTKGGQQTGSGSTSCKPDTTCTDFGKLCGYPGSCSAPPTDAGPGGQDSGSSNGCSQLACGGGSSPGGGTQCSCNRQCNGDTYMLSCTDTSCTCTKNGAPTSSFTGSGTCNDFPTCGYP